MIVSHSPEQGVSLAPHTSLKVGGPADWYSEPPDLDTLRSDLAFAEAHQLPILLVGGGSNLLVADAGIEGIVIRPLLQGHTLDIDGSVAHVRAYAGTSLGGLSRSLAKQGWSGLEWAATVPGCVGGAVVNNAGAFGSSIAESLVSATLLRSVRQLQSYSGQDLGYAYRTSVLKRGEIQGAVVIDATFRLSRVDPAIARAKIQGFQAQRSASQPRLLSAGSVFANPPGGYSGRLLEATGAKGLRQGQAEISTQHANFIVNHGGALADHIFQLVADAQERVWRQFGIWLHPEIELVGRWTDDQRNRLSKPSGKP
ncbi:MAG: UDP-N-acetylmuramate dehydrogenase [Chloroflexota bacterium]